MQPEKDGWDLGATTLSEEVVDELLGLQAEAQEKARLIRNCSLCTATWRDTKDGSVVRCFCYKDWKSAMITLRSAVKNAKEKREEWETDDMFDFHTVNYESMDDCVDHEKAKTLSIIAEKNLFEGLEPPYMDYFNRMHEPQC